MDKELMRHEVDWSQRRHERVLRIWQVAAISLGVGPDKEDVLKAGTNMPWRHECLKRRDFLVRRLTTDGEPQTGLVTWIRDHVAGIDRQAGHQMVDVVSAIEIMRPVFGVNLHPEFLALQDHLIGVPIPSALRDADPPQLPEKPKKDQTKTHATNRERALLAVIFGALRDKYAVGLAPSDLDTKNIAISISRKLEADGRKIRGTSVPAIVNLIGEAFRDAQSEGG